MDNGMRMLRDVLLLLLVVGVTLGQRCLLKDVPVQEHVDEARYSGSWFEMQFVQSEPNRFDTYTDYVEEYDFSPRGLFDIGHFRYTDRPADERCDGYARERRRIGPGRYEYDTASGSTEQRFVVETDYDSYQITFLCLELSSDGRYCETSELLIFSRHPQPLNSALLRKAVHRFNVLFGKARNCLRLDLAISNEHRFIGECRLGFDEIPTYVPPHPDYRYYEGNPYGYRGGNPYGYRGGNPYGYRGGNPYGYRGLYFNDPVFIRTGTKGLVAETTKLVAETALQGAQQRRLGVEIQLLKLRLGIHPEGREY